MEDAYEYLRVNDLLDRQEMRGLQEHYQEVRKLFDVNGNGQTDPDERKAREQFIQSLQNREGR